MNHRFLFLPILAAALAFPACKPNAETLLPISASSLPLMDDSAEQQATRRAFLDEANSVVEHYVASGDATYASPTYHITLLHLAAMKHRLALVNELLKEGADPNAVMLLPKYKPNDQGDLVCELVPCVTPIFAATRYTTEYRQEDAPVLVKALMRAGADINYRDPEGGGVLDCTLCAADWEGPAMELIDMGAKVQREDVLKLSEYGRYGVLAKILTSAEGEQWLKEPKLLHDLADDIPIYAEGHRKAYPHVCTCMELIIKNTADLNARNPETGMTPLAAATTYLQEVEERGKIYTVSPYADFIKALIEGGADPYAPGSANDLSTPADHLAVYYQRLVTPIYDEEERNGYDEFSVQEIRDAYAAAAYGTLRYADENPRGFGFAPPAHRFTAENLEAELIRLPLMVVTDDEVRAHWDALASAVTTPLPETAKRDERDKRELLEKKAVTLLHRADAARLAATICARPCWQDAAELQKKHGECSRWLKALREVKEAALPAAPMVEMARAALAAGKPGIARQLIRLLDRCPAEEAAPLLEELCADATPLALRAPAWSVKLTREGLPAFGNGEKEIYDWWSNTLNKEYKYQMPDALGIAKEAEDGTRRPALRTEELPMSKLGDVPSDVHSESESRALRAVGATLAADVYDAAGKDGAKASDAQKVEALLEAEYAIDRYIWKHREDIINPKEHVYDSDERSFLDKLFF